MDNNAEYHDPDYLSVSIKEEPLSERAEDKLEKIKDIIRREFANELNTRENEVMLIDQRMTTSRRLLHRLRYAIVNRYYNELKLQLTNEQIQDEITDQKDPRSKAQISSLLRESQRNIHPSLKKLLGKKTVDLSEIFKTRTPRNKVRKDYSAMLQKRHHTISADSTKSLRPEANIETEVEPCSSQVKKVPRHIEPKETNVMTLDKIIRNQMKHRYRIVIGNTSKYVPSMSSTDQSSHKWLLYVRGPPAAPDLSQLVRTVSIRLHHSYAPNHTIVLHKPPFHVSRRGWGEFPARIELQFALPHRNRPTIIEHTIRLDKKCTGIQTLGGETLVDVWLYSTPEMLEFEYKDESASDLQPAVPDQPSVPEQLPLPHHVEVKLEPKDPEPDSESQIDNWLDFFSKESKELDVDDMIIKTKVKTEEIDNLDAVMQSNGITEDNENSTHWPEENELPKEIVNQTTQPLKRIVKYIDPTTGKVYFLEMDRNLDLSKVQEIIINNTIAKVSPAMGNGLKKFRKKRGVSLLKPELKSLLKTDVSQNEIQHNYSHIDNDHCYLANPMHPVSGKQSASDVEIKTEQTLYEHLCSVVQRFDSIRAGVNYMLKRMPVISDDARDPDYLKHFPFTVESYEKYWKMDFAKRRNIEWSRAKIINTILSEYFVQLEPIWRTKQILIYARLHGYYPMRAELVTPKSDDNWTSWHMDCARSSETNIKEYYPTASHINTLSVFHKEDYIESAPEVHNLVDSDDEVDIQTVRSPARAKKESVNEGSFDNILPVEDPEERLRFLYLEKKCADIGIELRCENVGNGYYYSAVHSVLLCALRCFATELVRGALAEKLALDSPAGTVWTGSSSSRPVIGLEHVLMAMSNPRLRAFSAVDLGTKHNHKQTYL